MLTLVAQASGSTLTLSLDDVLSRAETSAGDVARAELDVLAAETDSARARAQILPSVTLGLDTREYFFGNQIIETRFVEAPESKRIEERDDLDLVYGPFRDQRLDSASHPGISLVLSARQLLFDGGRFWAQVLRADDYEDSRHHALRAAKNNARLEALRRFYGLARAKEALTVAEAQVRLAEENRTRSIATGKDLAFAERDVASDQVRLARARYSVRAARRSLSSFLALDPETPLEVEVAARVSTASVAPRRPPAQRLLTLALDRRPEILASRAIIEYLARTADMERGAHWPTVALTANYSRFSRRPDRVLADPTTNYTANAGLSFSFPVYSGGDVIARIDRAEIELARVRRQHEDLVRDVRLEVLDRCERVELLANVLRLARTEAAAAELVMKAAQSGYVAGSASATEERDAGLRWVEARRSVIESRYDLEVGLAELARATGGALPQD